MEQFLTSSLGFYLFGYLGLLLDAIDDFKPTNGLDGLVAHIKKEAFAIIVGFISYNALIYMWYTSGIDFFGLPVGTLHGMTLMLGYSAQGLLMFVFSNVKNKWTGGPPAALSIPALMALGWVMCAVFFSLYMMVVT